MRANVIDPARVRELFTYDHEAGVLLCARLARAVLMPATYTTRQDETVDLACFRHYGRTGSVTEVVLDANPGLAGLGPVLPFATAILMPDVPSAAKQPTLVSLWD